MAPSTRSSRALYDHFDPGSEAYSEEEPECIDVEMTIEDNEREYEEPDLMDHDPISNIREDRIIIAIDFGTTFSSVAYAVLQKGVAPENVDIRRVECIGRYPGYDIPNGMLDDRQDVPTELWYSFEDQSPPRNPINEEDSSSSDDESSPGHSSGLEDDDGLDENTDVPRANLCDTSVPQYWGFNVQRHLNTMNIPRDTVSPLTRFKLTLDNTEDTMKLRTDLGTILSTLHAKNIIKDDSDIFADYLTHLLRHSKEQLELSDELKSNLVFQFVLCVPAKWPVKACRTMQTALERAVQRAGFGVKAQEGAHNLFMISEPEAAAECILSEARSELYHGETVVIVDAGGGTIDAVTYKCAHDDPLRLTEEVVAPDSKLFGASYINEKFEEKLLKKLANEDYLIENGKTLKSIVQKCATFFENNEKRRIDINNLRAPIASIYIDNLRENPSKRFYQNRLELRRKTVREFYKEPLEAVEAVLESQLQRAEGAEHTVQKVILTGGFGQSPSLQSCLKKYLKEKRNIRGGEIELIVPRNPSTTVARGAVLRALNKRLGPSRHSQCSYGILISEPYEPEVYKEHLMTRCRINSADGEKYVDDTIRWVIQKGERLQNWQEFAYDVKHTFALTRKKLTAAEELWMSDYPHPLHYRKTHPLNKGAMKIGTIVADLTPLRDQGLIEPESPSDFSNHSRSKKHWEVHYEVAMIVEGRSIRFEARWPSKESRKGGPIVNRFDSKLIGIAAAFKPGTA